MFLQNSKIIFFILIIVAVVFEIIGDVLFKKWSVDTKNTLLYIGLLIYFVGTVFWAISLRYEFLSKAISVFTLLNLIAIVAVGVFYFNEDLSVVNKIGIALGVVSIVLIEL